MGTSEACRKRSVFKLLFYTENFPGSILRKCQSWKQTESVVQARISHVSIYMRVVGLGNAFLYDSLIHTISFLYLSKIYMAQLLDVRNGITWKQEERGDAAHTFLAVRTLRIG